MILVISCKDGDSFWESIVPETDKETTQSQIKGYIFRPALTAANDENVSRLKVPSGFKVNKFAECLGKPRIFVTTNKGDVYASDREAGIVIKLRDADGDGIAEDKKNVQILNRSMGWPFLMGRCI